MSSRVKPLSELLALGFEVVEARRVAIAVRKGSDNPFAAVLHRLGQVGMSKRLGVTLELKRQSLRAHAARDVDSFGKAIADATWQNPDWTSISGVIDFWVRLLTDAGYRATRRAIAYPEMAPIMTDDQRIRHAMLR